MDISPLIEELDVSSPREWSEIVIGDGERFDELLEMKSRDRKLGKRERTRFLVLSRVARQLLNEPAKRPVVEVVLDETGLSRGTFYNYFTDIDEAVEAVLSAFFKALWPRRSLRPSADRNGSDYDAVYEANLWYCRAYETNAGLFAAFSQVAAYTPSLLRMREAMNADWVERVISATARKRGRQFEPSERRVFQGALRLLIAMSIEALRERCIHRDELLCSSFPDIETLAQGLTAIWQRTIDEHAGK